MELLTGPAFRDIHIYIYILSVVVNHYAYYFISPKGPCTHMVYTWASKSSLYRYFGAKVYTIWVHGPLGFMNLHVTDHRPTSSAWGHRQKDAQVLPELHPTNPSHTSCDSCGYRDYSVPKDPNCTNPSTPHSDPDTRLNPKNRTPLNPKAHEP